MKLDDYLGAYFEAVTAGLGDTKPDAHEWAGEDADDYAGGYWLWRKGNPSIGETWPDRVVIVWDVRSGWIDQDSNPLPIDSLADPGDVARAIREHVAGLPATTSPDGPRWRNAAELEDLLTVYAEASE